MLDDELDPLIDDVARAMTSAPADPDLARRVSARIAEAGDRRAVRWRMMRPWVLVPVASACVLLLAVFVAREGSVRLKPDATPVTTSSTRPGAAPPRPPVASGFRRTDTGEPRRLPDVPPATVALLEVKRLDVQPLVEMDAIQISPIAIDRIEIAAMP